MKPKVLFSNVLKLLPFILCSWNVACIMDLAKENYNTKEYDILLSSLILMFS